MIPGFQLIENDLIRDIKGKLDRGGIFYRIFSRIKASQSIEEKIRLKGDYSTEKKIQDIFGIRIITYFIDDVKIIYDFLKEGLSFANEQIDVPTLTEFKPTRTNMVFNLNPDSCKIFNASIETINLNYKDLLDTTFELQLRTIFSEGWHEIDHSLRYKSKENWINMDEEERFFNGIFASLEISDRILPKLFDEMAYTHFKTKNIESLVRTKFRLKFNTKKLAYKLQKHFLKRDALLKDLYKLDRDNVVSLFIKKQFSFPLTIDSFIFFINYFWLKDEKIKEDTPSILFEEFN